MNTSIKQPIFYLYFDWTTFLDFSLQILREIHDHDLNFILGLNKLELFLDYLFLISYFIFLGLKFRIFGFWNICRIILIVLMHLFIIEVETLLKNRLNLENLLRKILLRFPHFFQKFFQIFDRPDKLFIILINLR